MFWVMTVAGPCDFSIFNNISKEKLRRFYYIAQLLVEPNVVLVSHLGNRK